MPSASERVTRNNPAETVLTEGPKRCCRSWYDVTSAPRKYCGRKMMVTMIRPSTYPAASCRNVQFPAYADAGTPMKVSVLVSVATIVKQIAHHGVDWSVRK